MEASEVVQLSIPIPGRALGIRAKNTGILNLRVLEVAVVILVLAICATRARADAALLMEEPYGTFSDLLEPCVCGVSR
jgi:hypothetical protein